MIIKKPCDYCGKISDITSEIDLGPAGKIITLACNHSYVEQSLVKESSNEQTESLFSQLEKAVPEYCEKHERNCIKVWESKSGKHLFPYQKDVIVKAYKNNAKFIFDDEMGLGKTIQV